MRRNQEVFFAKLAVFDAAVADGLRRKTLERELGVLDAMARAASGSEERRQMLGIVADRAAALNDRLVVDQRSQRTSRSVRAISGGLPTLGRRR